MSRPDYQPEYIERAFGGFIDTVKHELGRLLVREPVGTYDSGVRHQFLASANPRQANTCLRCGRPKDSAAHA